jgi:hypothetical protein
MFISELKRTNARATFPPNKSVKNQTIQNNAQFRRYGAIRQITVTTDDYNTTRYGTTVLSNQGQYFPSSYG